MMTEGRGWRDVGPQAKECGRLWKWEKEGNILPWSLQKEPAL